MTPSYTTEQEREALDKWLVKQCENLSEVMNPYLMKGGDLNDPQYRQQLGEHQGYMRVRSWLSGSRNITPESE